MPVLEPAGQAGSLASVNSTDRSLGAAVHVCSIFWPLLAPLVGWAVFRKNAFVAAHSKQALLETVVLNVALFLMALVSVVYTVVQINHFIQTDWQDFNLMAFILRFAVGWLLLLLLGVANTVFSVVQAAGALSGRWPRSVRRL